MGGERTGLNGPELLALAGVTVGGLAAAYAAGYPLAAGFSLGLLLLYALMRRRGGATRELWRAMGRGLLQAKGIIAILLLVGALIPAWTLEGAIPLMIRIGLAKLDPQWYLTGTFALSAAVSMLLGTATGTLSFIGIPLVGAGALLGVPLPLAASAAVSGALVGDRSSPMSGAFQLIASATGTDPGRQWRALVPTTAAAFAAAILVYAGLDLAGSRPAEQAALGLFYAPVDWAAEGVLLLPPAVLLAALLLRRGVRGAFLLSIAAAVAVGALARDIGAWAWADALWNGVAPPSPELDGTARIGGLASMAGLVALLVLAGAFNGILEATGALKPYTQSLLKPDSPQAGATVRVGLLGFALCLLTCTQTLPILMSGRNLLPLWERRFERADLARVISDTSAVFAAAIPWNMFASVCGAIIGVPPERYLPASVFLWSLPAFTLLRSAYLDRSERRRGRLSRGTVSDNRRG